MSSRSSFLLRQVLTHRSNFLSTQATVKLPRQHEWNRAVKNAEKLVGFPTSMVNLQSLMHDDVSLTDHVRKLMGSDHPVLKSLKRLIIHGGQNNIQVRGLMMLLLAKSLNGPNEALRQRSDFEEETSILGTQRKLAEIVEMISAAYSIHKSVLNLPFELPEDSSEDTKDDLNQLEYGNKIAILGGDYLLANACVGLADLRNTYIVEMVAIAISEFTQSEFYGKRDVQGRLIPDEDSIQVKDWINRNKMANGSLLASGFKGVGMLANLDDEVTERCERIGRNLAVAWQAFLELQPFLEDKSNFETEWNLGCAPVLFHFQGDPNLLEYVQTCQEDVDNLDMKKVRLLEGVLKSEIDSFPSFADFYMCYERRIWNPDDQRCMQIPCSRRYQRSESCS